MSDRDKVRLIIPSTYPYNILKNFVKIGPVHSQITGLQEDR